MSTRSPSAAPRGSQRPRHTQLPDARFSRADGVEAVEFASAAGLTLDPWQSHTLTESLAQSRFGKWAAPEVGVIVPRQNGKGSILEARELAGLFLFREKLILHSAHEFKTAAEGFRRLLQLVEGTDELRRQVAKVSTAHGAEGIELTRKAGGGRLRVMARSKGSGRGFSGDVIILDEAYALSDADMDAIISTQAARANPQTIYASSAPLADSTVLRRVCLRGRAGDSKGLAYFEWCADPEDASDDREAWARANPAFGYRLSEEFTETELGALSPEGFRRERLGIWLEAERPGLIPAAAWAALVDVESAPTSTLVFAPDVSPTRSHASISVAGLRADGDPHVECVDARPEAWWLFDRFVELRAKWGEFVIVIDEASAAGFLVKPLRDAGFDVRVPTSRQYSGACGRFFDACSPARQGLRHRGQAWLADAVAAAVSRPLGDAWAWDRRKPTADITPLVAATLALWGLDEADGGDIADQVF